MKHVLLVIATLILFNRSSQADSEKTVRLQSTTGQTFEVYESAFREVYATVFGLGKSTNFEKRIENEDGTVTLIAPKYKFQNVDYSVAIFHGNKPLADGVCKLYGFASYHLLDKKTEKNLVCAYIDEAGHFVGLRETHMENGKETFYECLATITCIP